MPKLHDLSGERFGMLTAIRYDETEKKWLCKCDCGTEKLVSRTHLKSGHTKSCGCLNSRVVSQRNQRHGLSGTRIYKIYYGMIQRCYVERNPAFKDYGDRGIYICDEWKEDFRAFYDWAMKNGYSDELTIDRIDNNGPYSPENCHWVTQKAQCGNKRNNIMVEGKPLKQVCRERRLKYHTVYARIKRGYSPEKALESADMRKEKP